MCHSQQNGVSLQARELEWRLVSPRLVFEKLHEAPRGKQMKICGNIVNVPANVVNTVTVLPRLSQEAGTIKVQLKRKLKYKSYTLSQNVRPAKVFEAAKWLNEKLKVFPLRSCRLKNPKSISYKMNKTYDYLITYQQNKTHNWKMDHNLDPQKTIFETKEESELKL